MQRTVVACLIVVVLVGGGCREKPDEFQEYLWDVSDFGTLLLPSGAEVEPYRLSLEREESEFHPVVLVEWRRDGDPDYIMDIRAVQRDLEYLAALASQFAMNERWDGECEVRSQITRRDQYCFTYLASTDKMHEPEGYRFLKRVVWDFGTLDLMEVICMPGGSLYMYQRGCGKLNPDGKTTDYVAWRRNCYNKEAISINRGRVERLFPS